MRAQKETNSSRAFSSVGAARRKAEEATAPPNDQEEIQRLFLNARGLVNLTSKQAYKHF